MTPHKRVRKLLPVWRKDDICPLRDTVTLSCLWSNNYFSFFKRLSFLCCCTSDVRTCQKWQAWALQTLGSPRWIWHIPKTPPRAWRKQAGEAFGVKERPFYVPFKCVRVKERSVLLKASRLSLNVSKLFPHTRVLKDISLKVFSSSQFTLSLLLKKIILVSLAKQLKDSQDTIGVSSQGLSSVQRGVERDVHSAVMSHGVDSCPYFTWID